ncbi:hypothetical protein ACE6H2_000848 [Prunus campanulata]
MQNQELNGTWIWLKGHMNGLKTVVPNVSRWNSVVKQGLLEAGIGPNNGFNLNHIPGTKVTGSIFDNEGRRHGAAELLNRADPKNMRVAVHATVERIIFSSNASSKFPGPSSYGSLTLQSSSDVKVGPNVRFNYYAHPLDLARCVSGTRKIGDLLRTNSLKPFKTQDLPGVEGFNFFGLPLPMNQTDNASFENFCRETTATFWHYHGGCLMGKVVDGDLRVRRINMQYVLLMALHLICHQGPILKPPS